MPSYHTVPRPRPAFIPTRRPHPLAALGVATLMLVLLGLAGRPAPVLAASWVSEPSPTTNALESVACVSLSFCTAVGGSAVAPITTTIASFNGTSWSTEVNDPGELLRAVACVSPNFCKAAGEDGTVLSYNGTSWSAEASSTTRTHWDVACVSSSFCKAVASLGTIVSWDGTSWSTEASGDLPDPYLFGVACVSTGFCKAVGDGPTILSWNGTSWSTEASGPINGPQQLNEVACLSPSFCKAVGANEATGSGFILSFNGSGWSEEASGTTSTLQDVACVSSSFCKAVGREGTILSWDGTSWSPDTSGTTESLIGISCVTAGFCKAVGREGTILSLVPSDTTPPTLSCSASPNQLWPPNHQLVPVTITVTASDPGTASMPTVTLVSVVSSEPDNGLGDGDTTGDIQSWTTGTDDRMGQLRAERAAKGTGRVYTLTYRATDAAGNAATATCTVTVPRNQAG